MKKSWVFLVSFGGRPPVWCGNVIADSRVKAKSESIRVASEVLPLDAKIIRICQGSLELDVGGDSFEFDDVDQQATNPAELEVAV